jgi:hypothetical protein
MQAQEHGEALAVPVPFPVLVLLLLLVLVPVSVPVSVPVPVPALQFASLVLSLKAHAAKYRATRWTSNFPHPRVRERVPLRCVRVRLILRCRNIGIGIGIGIGGEIEIEIGGSYDSPWKVRESTATPNRVHARTAWPVGKWVAGRSRSGVQQASQAPPPRCREKEWISSWTWMHRVG